MKASVIPITMRCDIFSQSAARCLREGDEKRVSLRVGKHDALATVVPAECTDIFLAARQTYIREL